MIRVAADEPILNRYTNINAGYEFDF